MDYQNTIFDGKKIPTLTLLNILETGDFVGGIANQLSLPNKTVKTALNSLLITRNTQMAIELFKERTNTTPSRAEYIVTEVSNLTKVML